MEIMGYAVLYIGPLSFAAYCQENLLDCEIPEQRELEWTGDRVRQEVFEYDIHLPGELNPCVIYDIEFDFVLGEHHAYVRVPELLSDQHLQELVSKTRLVVHNMSLNNRKMGRD